MENKTLEYVISFYIQYNWSAWTVISEKHTLHVIQHYVPDVQVGLGDLVFGG
jgi:hypothetical protein